MGTTFFDQYSILHFSSGVIAYFFNIKLIQWIIIHFLFEYFENSNWGIEFINKYLIVVWPGGKDNADTFQNSMLGDNFFAILGWVISYYFDLYYKKK